jgi:hypothetical protein
MLLAAYSIPLSVPLQPKSGSCGHCVGPGPVAVVAYSVIICAPFPSGRPMKKTLYQILGVDPKASQQEIEAAYIARIDELKFATLQDPNKLRVLQQSKEILSDANQRATYDASIAVRASPEPRVIEEEPEPTVLEQWGKWIAAGVIVIAAGLWWANHRVAPPAPRPATPATPQAGSQPASPAPHRRSRPLSLLLRPMLQMPSLMYLQPLPPSARSWGNGPVTMRSPDIPANTVSSRTARSTS